MSETIQAYLDQIDSITLSNLKIVDTHIALKRKLIKRNVEMELLFITKLEKEKNNGKVN